MTEAVSTFSSVLRDILIGERLTPSQLAARANLSVASVESWLRTGQVPKAKSVWKIASVLQGHELPLFTNALSDFHRRTAENFKPNKVLRYEKTISTYLGEGFSQIPDDEQQRYSEIWQAVLNAEQQPYPTNSAADASSDLIILPKPTLLVLDDWARVLKEIAADNLRIYDLSWKKFEDLIAHLLHGYGWEITPMGYTKDEGIDLIAVRRLPPDLRMSMMVQCKRFSDNRKVGVEIVREVWSVKWEKGFHQAMIATTSAFTRGAKMKGEKWDLALKDQGAIVEWCRDLGSRSLTTRSKGPA